MNLACIKARENLNSRFQEIKNLHPEYLDIGTPAYMSPNRICFSIKLVNGKRKSVQYARILLELKLGRVLTQDETVDHIDFDSTNNSFENLQLLSRIENARKGSDFETKAKANAATSLRMKGNKLGLGLKNGMTKLTDKQLTEIRDLQKNHYRGQDSIIATQYGVSRELISQIRRNKARIG